MARAANHRSDAGTQWSTNSETRNRNPNPTPTLNPELASVDSYCERVARRTTRIFRWRRCCCPPRCGRTSRRSTRSRGWPTTSPTKGDRRRRSGSPGSTAWQRAARIAAAYGRTARPGDQHADVLPGAARHTIRMLVCRVRCSTIWSARSVRMSWSRDTPGADVLDYCRRSANPVGRLVLRIAGYATPALDAHVGRRVHGAAADQLLAGPRDRLARAAACTCPRTSGSLRARARQDLDAARLTPEWRARCSTVAVTDAIARSRRGGASATASTDACASSSRDMARRHADPRPARARRGSMSSPVGRRSARRTPLRSPGARSRWSRRCCGPRHQLLLLLPRPSAEKRRAIIAVWDFCRAVDDAVDEAAGTTDGPAAKELALWRGELARCFADEPPGRRRAAHFNRLVGRVHASAAGIRGVDRRRRDGPVSAPLRRHLPSSTSTAGVWRRPSG